MDINDCKATLIKATDFGDFYVMTVSTINWLPILAEINTHRQHMVKNARSQRAVPVDKLRHEVLGDTFYPHFTQHNTGMVSNKPVTGWRLAGANAVHKGLAFINSAGAYIQHKVFGVNKGTANRYLSPFLASHQIITFYIHKTEHGGFHNLLELRTHESAEPHFRAMANSLEEMHTMIMDGRIPLEQPYKGWHIPMIMETDQDKPLLEQLDISAGRVAMVSYYSPGEKGPNPKKDQARSIKMRTSAPLHASPFEHQVKGLTPDQRADLRERYGMTYFGGALTDNVLQYRTVIEYDLVDEVDYL